MVKNKEKDCLFEYFFLKKNPRVSNLLIVFRTMSQFIKESLWIIILKDKDFINGLIKDLILETEKIIK